MLGAWEHVVEFALDCLGQGAPGLAQAIARDYARRRREAMRLFPESLDCLSELRRRSVPLALVTNGDALQQRDKIERHGLARYFDTIVIEREFGVGKRYAAVYRQALRTLGASPTEAWMVGDHLEWDVDAPQRLGLMGVWIDRGGRGLPPDSAVLAPRGSESGRYLRCARLHQGTHKLPRDARRR